MSATPITREVIQGKLRTLMEGVQQLWGVTNPGATENMVADLLLISLALKNPAHAARLDLIAKLVNASDNDEMAQPLKLLATTETDSPEFDLVRFILGGTDMPSWEDIAAKVVTLAIADGQTVAPAPKPTPPPTATPTQPAPDADDPATLLARLNGGPATATVTPPAADANGTATAQPVDNGGGTRRQRRRATRGAGQPTAQS